MFNKDFYPTPKAFADSILFGFCKGVKSVLEPSAGKGDFALSLVERVRKDAGYYSNIKISDVDIDCIEIEPELQSILKDKGFRVVYDNFLTFHTYKRYDLICMNPPFSDGAKHLLKALEMQQNGGKILCLLNAETIRNPYTNERKDLLRKLEEVNAEIEYKQNVFMTAERKTDVEIAVIKIDIPYKNFSSDLFDGLKKSANEQIPDYEELNRFQMANKDIVKSAILMYEQEAKAGIKLISEFRAMESMMMKSFPGKEENFSNGTIFDLKIGKESASSRNAENAFLKVLRMKYWRELFGNPLFMSQLTSNLKNEYRSRIEDLANYDFSLYNIYTLQLEMFQHMTKSVDETIINLFDEFSHKHYWDKNTSSNIHYYNGWATNSAYKVNKKVIIPLNAYDSRFGRFECSNYRGIEKLKDIQKVFEYLDGGRTDNIDIYNRLTLAEKLGKSKNIDLKFFTVTFYKKGTVHITFKDDELLKKFNIFGSQRKNWLPPSYGKKDYSSMTQEEKNVVKAFEGEQSYKETIQNKDFFMVENSKLLLLNETN